MSRVRTNEELGRLVRAALKGKRVKRRRLYELLRGVDPDDQYMESDADFMENNRDVCVAILESLAPPRPKRKSS